MKQQQQNMKTNIVMCFVIFSHNVGHTISSLHVMCAMSLPWLVLFVTICRNSITLWYALLFFMALRVHCWCLATTPLPILCQPAVVAAHFSLMQQYDASVPARSQWGIIMAWTWTGNISSGVYLPVPDTLTTSTAAPANHTYVDVKLNFQWVNRFFGKSNFLCPATLCVHYYILCLFYWNAFVAILKHLLIEMTRERCSAVGSRVLCVSCVWHWPTSNRIDAVFFLLFMCFY